MQDDTESPPTHVLRTPVIVEAIKTLNQRKIHEALPAYLHVRERAASTVEGTVVTPDWSQVGRILAVPGGPPTKPYYRPFSSRRLSDPSGYWLNPNLAGSYAASSLRRTASFMLDSGNNFRLTSDHAQKALSQLLYGAKLPAWALASYYLRNHAFALDNDVDQMALISAFKTWHKFDESGDFAILFDDSPARLQPSGWFEVWEDPQTARHRTVQGA